jgi:hypothetical protein
VNSSINAEQVEERVTDDLLVKREVAKKLKRSVRTIDAWMRQGRLPYIKLGRITPRSHCSQTSSVRRFGFFNSAARGSQTGSTMKGSNERRSTNQGIAARTRRRPCSTSFSEWAP